jgi:Protein of unknown function (DUF1501)
MTRGKSVNRSGCQNLNLALALSRREVIRAGGLSLFGLGLPRFLEAQATTEDSARSSGPARLSGSFGKAKSCILLFMWGGPAQQETWDLKPDAPEQVRGEFRPIATNVPGVHISEHFPFLARQLDRLAIIRSVHHADVNHTTATHELLTGRPIPRPGGGEFREDWPHYGAVLAHLNRGRERTALPAYVQMRPEIPNGAPRFVEESHGQGAGWMGPALSPLTIDQDPSKPSYKMDQFRLPETLSQSRVADRSRLLRAVDDQAKHFEAAAQIHALSQHYTRAYDLLASKKAMEAFDLEREDPRRRDRYGWHAHGQSVLQARRLVEAGVPLVTIFWPNEGLTNVSVYWDTHNRNFIDLKTRLMPPADQAFSALLDDLSARGLLEETLVIWTGEFGRTPRVGQSVVGGAGAGRDGRDHWAHCFSTVMAGAGIRGGTVYGASDRWAAYPARDPVTPADIAATIYHCLGVNPATELIDSLNRPMALCLGQPISGILA